MAFTFTLSRKQKVWWDGAVNSFVSGCTTIAFGQLVGLTLKQQLVITLGSGGMSFWKWLKQHPIPIADDPADYNPTPTPPGILSPIPQTNPIPQINVSANVRSAGGGH